MASTSAWDVWIDHPYPLGQGSRGAAPIQETVRLVYGEEVTYEGWCWEYHTVSIGPMSRARGGHRHGTARHASATDTRGHAPAVERRMPLRPYGSGCGSSLVGTGL